MKCENCGKNEVTFVYHSNINGKVEEKHLCSECAGQLGYMKKLVLHSRAMHEELFGSRLFGRSMFEDFFSPRMGWLSPFEELFEEMPALSAAKEKPAEEDHLLGEKEQGHFARMRKLNALRAEMKKAVRQEEFERAAQLRDEIRALENTKESA